jgi:hypothetical protein
MNRVRNATRVVFLLLAVVLIVYLNKKTDDNTRSVVEFKFNMLQNIRADSLDSRQKLDMVRRETTKFIDGSSHVRRGLDYLMGLLALAIVVELGFLVLKKRNQYYRKQNT